MNTRSTLALVLALQATNRASAHARGSENRSDASQHRPQDVVKLRSAMSRRTTTRARLHPRANRFDRALALAH